MKIKCNAFKPTKQKDGSWKVIVEEVEEDVPELGREHMMCNVCGFTAYPKCKEWCKAYLPQKAASLKSQD